MLVGKNYLSKFEHPELLLQESSSRACDSLIEADMKCSTKRHLLQSSNISSDQSSHYSQKKSGLVCISEHSPTALAQTRGHGHSAGLQILCHCSPHSEQQLHRHTVPI